MTEPTAATVVTLRGNRTRTVPLEYPAELSDGTVLQEITVRRMSTEEMAAFVAAAKEGRDYPLPTFSVPDAILDALDPDDFDAVNRAAMEMLPRRLQRALDAVEQEQPAEPAPPPLTV
jgi:hypothetical protein